MRSENRAGAELRSARKRPGEHADPDVALRADDPLRHARRAGASTNDSNLLSGRFPVNRRRAFSSFGPATPGGHSSASLHP